MNEEHATLIRSGTDELIGKFYRNYPTMTPFVGQRFADRGRPAVLLVGESHYLPNDSVAHLQSELWYAGTSDALSAREKTWMNTAEGMTAARRERFKNRAHSIWRHSLRIFNAHGPRHDDFAAAAQDIAFYNFFLRPAREGKSLQVTSQDEDFANLAFEHWRQRLAPTFVIFLSALAYRSLRVRSSETPTAVVPHPASHWWNRTSPKYGGKSGRARFAELVDALQWPSTRYV
jgi:hypothetical protein